MRYYQFRPPGIGFGGMPPIGNVTKRLLLANIGIFVMQALFFSSASRPDPLFGLLALSAHGLGRGMVWQLVTYMFLHGHLWHLFGNMLGLFFFGRELEMRLGARRFIYLYIGGGVLGALGWLLLGALGLYSLAHPMIGASGAVFAIVGAYAALYPGRQVTLLLFFVIPVTMTARTMAILFGGFSLLMLGDRTPIAHAAHLAGGIAGYLYGLQLVRSGAFYRPSSFSGMSRFWRPREWLAKLRRSRLRVYRTPDREVSVDWARVDQILIKIKAQGFGALTSSERAELERASRSAEQRRR